MTNSQLHHRMLLQKAVKKPVTYKKKKKEKKKEKEKERKETRADYLQAHETQIC